MKGGAAAAGDGIGTGGEGNGAEDFSSAQPSAPDSPLALLTAKQREVLDLLIEHKTSKEIAQILGISPYTVDQRINGARAHLSVERRGEVASAYRRLKEEASIGAQTPQNPIYGKTAYGFSYIAENAYLEETGFGNDAAPSQATGPEAALKEVSIGASTKDASVQDFRVAPELFDGHWGTLARLGAIMLIALLLILVAVGGTGLFLTLSQLYRH